MGVTCLLLTLSPTCPTYPGFSRQLVAILNEIGVEYSSFNILADEEVRQGERGESEGVPLSAQECIRMGDSCTVM